MTIPCNIFAPRLKLGYNGMWYLVWLSSAEKQDWLNDNPEFANLCHSSFNGFDNALEINLLTAGAIAQ